MEIPQYPSSRSLAMADKKILDQLFSNVQPQISELTFAGLYLFRNAHDYRLTTVADSIVLLGKGYDGAQYFLPPLGGHVAETVRILMDRRLPLYGADELFIAGYAGIHELICSEQRDSFDYLYLREELATLPGSRFHKKKNRINYFTNHHDYTVALYAGQHLPGCLKLLDQWANNLPDNNTRSLTMEIEATAEALYRAEQLGLEGVVILVDGSIAAFALGERLNNETAVCHFEKADPFMEGLYQLINREFARLLFPECRYLNREQDLGDTGLRNAKLSCHPIELVKKYLISKRDL